jgi:hypothetical protein
MSRNQERVEIGDVRKAERAIVMQLLRDDRAPRWKVAELADEIADFDAALVELALVRLEHERVLERAGARIWASRAARWLDELELIGI